MKAFHIQIIPLLMAVFFIPWNAYGNNELPGHERLPTKSYGNVKNKFKVVIDAGHGGKDSGTRGSKVFEKNIALSLALKLGKKIASEHPDVEVVYTREKDIFIPLFERIAIANQEKADLFISIHCNATSKGNVSGTETFVMGLHRADENLETAKRENSVILMENDYQQNYDGYDPNSDIGHIILSTYQNTYLEKSIEFASLVEESFGVKTSRGVKQAGFVVLRRATMPSVLVEVGFLSNRQEEKLLASEEGQKKIVFAMAGAFAKYKLKKLEEESLLASASQPEPKNEKTSSEPVKTSKEQSTASMVYSVQVGATLKKNNEAFAVVPELRVEKEENLYKYYSGIYNDRTSAENARKKLRELGYKDSFIVVYPKDKMSYAQK